MSRISLPLRVCKDGGGGRPAAPTVIAYGLMTLTLSVEMKSNNGTF